MQQGVGTARIEPTAINICSQKWTMYYTASSLNVAVVIVETTTIAYCQYKYVSDNSVAAVLGAP